MRRFAWSKVSSRPAHRRSRGTSVVEFVIALPLLCVMVLALIEFGHLIQSRLIIANVSREGGSIGSRTLVIDAGVANMVAVSGHPLDLAGPDGRVILTRVKAGTSSNATSPRIVTQVVVGGYAKASALTDNGSGVVGLPPNLYDHLVWKQQYNGAQITDLTMCEVYYHYVPITPLPYFSYFFDGLLTTSGLVLQSKAIF